MKVWSTFPRSAQRLEGLEDDVLTATWMTRLSFVTFVRFGVLCHADVWIFALNPFMPLTFRSRIAPPGWRRGGASASAHVVEQLPCQLTGSGWRWL